MQAPISRKRLEFAAVGFLAEMRRQAIKANPAGENPVRQFDEYSPEHRSALMEALKVASSMLSAEKEPHFEAWLNQNGQNTGA